jgi:hypothetical protein
MVHEFLRLGSRKTASIEKQYKSRAVHDAVRYDREASSSMMVAETVWRVAASDSDRRGMIEPCDLRYG